MTEQRIEYLIAKAITDNWNAYAGKHGLQAMPLEGSCVCARTAIAMMRFIDDDDNVKVELKTEDELIQDVVRMAGQVARYPEGDLMHEEALTKLLKLTKTLEAVRERKAQDHADGGDGVVLARDDVEASADA